MENIMELRLSRFSIRKLQYKPVKRRKKDTLYPGLKNSYKYTIHEFLFPFYFFLIVIHVQPRPPYCIR